MCTISDIIIGPIAQKRKQSPPPPFHNVVSVKAMTMLSYIVLYHVAIYYLAHEATLKRGRGIFIRILHDCIQK